ncbi:MAG: hypothetical protein IJ503_03485 [Akkermansia sp.]|nr:hypothetical protein [Akkermansia sp.]
MTEREIKRGDIVRIREEWLDPGEDGSITYVVLKERGSGHVLVQALGTGLPLAPTYVYDVAWLRYAGTVLTEMSESD